MRAKHRWSRINVHQSVVAYYSSAKPESGYSAAVRGYAHKIAAALHYEALEVASPDALPECVPEISIGLQEAAWPSTRPRLELKARPYADQHGQGPSMHPLTYEALAQVRHDASASMGLVCVANPHWLITDAEMWAQRIEAWAHCNALESLIVSNSPRTNALMWEPFVSALKQALSVAVTFNKCGEKNRYHEALASADAICILGSSRSMAGEVAMSRAAMAYVADDAISENAFFGDTPATIAPRYHRFSETTQLPNGPFEPHDVTQSYINEALTQIKQSKAA